MILQALTEYYRTLEDRGEVPPPGWSKVKIAYALCINEEGRLEQVISTQTEQKRGNKTIIAPQSMELPAPIKRSSGIAANFLWDSSTYLLGVDNKGKPQRALDCFKAAKELHENLLSQVSTPAARAILAFFQTWQPEQAIFLWLEMKTRVSMDSGRHIRRHCCHLKRSIREQKSF